MRDLDNNKRSVFLLNYILVLAIKYCRGVITDEVSARLKEIFLDIAKEYNITLLQWSFSKDFVKIRFKAHPNSSLAKFINAYKSASSRHIKKEFPEIKELLFEDSFWAKSYCLLSIGSENERAITEFLDAQREPYSSE